MTEVQIDTKGNSFDQDLNALGSPKAHKTLSDHSMRTRSSLRLGYEAQARQIAHQIGSLEDVRQRLGLSRRRICQLLLVDPSAWTRWTRDPGSIPPLVYQALHWYLQSQERGRDIGAPLSQDKPKTHVSQPELSLPWKLLLLSQLLLTGLLIGFLLHGWFRA